MSDYPSVEDQAAAVAQVVNTVADLMAEPRPRRESPPLPRWGRDPVGQTLTGFDLAGELVSATDYAATLSGWKGRQARLKHWRDMLQAERPGGTGEMDGVELGMALLRSRYQQEILDDIAQMLFALAERAKASGAVHSAVGNACDRVASIVERYQRRRREIVAADSSDFSAVNDTACAHINAQTRRVLDLKDPNLTVSEFLASHGLRTKPSWPLH